jgi:hypothetical protein
MVVSGCEFMNGGKKEIVLEKGLKAAAWCLGGALAATRNEPSPWAVRSAKL